MISDEDAWVATELDVAGTDLEPVLNLPRSLREY